MAGRTAIEAGRAFVKLFAEDSDLQRGLNSALRSVRKFASSVQQIGRTLFAGGLGSGFLISLAAQTFADFEDGMLMVQGITKASTKDMKALTAEAARLGRTTSFTAIEVANSMGELARGGASAQQILYSMNSVLGLARGSMTDLTLATQAVVTTMSQFGLGIQEAARVTDTLLIAANSSVQTVEDLQEALAYVALDAKDAGLSLEDTAAMLALIANGGVKGSAAGTQLRRAIRNLSDEAKGLKLESQFKKFNFEITKADGNFRPFVAIMRDLNDLTRSMPNPKRIALFENIFGRGSNAAKIVGSSAAQFDVILDKFDEFEGETDRLAALMDSGLGGAVRLTISAFEGLKIALGEALSGAIRETLEWLTRIMTGLSEWISENKDLMTQLYRTVRAVLLAGGAMLGFSVLLRLAAFSVGWLFESMRLAVMGSVLLGAKIKWLTMVVGGFLVSVPLIGPLLAAAFGGAVLASIGLLGNKIKEVFNGVIPIVSQMAAGVAAALNKGEIQQAIDVVKTGFMALKAQIADSLGFDLTKFRVAMIKVQHEFSKLKAWAVAELSKIRAFFSIAFEGVGDTLAAVPEVLGPIFTAMATAIKNAFVSFGATVADIFGSIVGIAVETGKFIFTAFKWLFFPKQMLFWTMFGDYIKWALALAWRFSTDMISIIFNIGDEFKLFVAILKRSWSNLMGDLTSAFAESIALMGAAWTGLKAGLAHAARGVKEGVMIAVGLLGEMMKGIWEGIKYMGSVAGSLLSAGASAVNSYVLEPITQGFLKPFIDEMKEDLGIAASYVMGFAKQAGGWLLSPFKFLAEGAAFWGTVLWDKMGPVIEMIAGAFEAAWQGVASTLRWVGGQIGAVFGGIQTWLGMLIPAIQEVGNMFWAVIDATIIAALRFVGEFFVGVYHTFATIIRKIGDNFMSLGMMIWESITTPLSNIANYFLDIWQTIGQSFNKVVEFLSSTFSGFVDLLADLWGSWVKDGFTGLFYSASQMLAEGIIGLQYQLGLISFEDLMIQQQSVQDTYDKKRKDNANAIRAADEKRNREQAMSAFESAFGQFREEFQAGMDPNTFENTMKRFESAMAAAQSEAEAAEETLKNSVMGSAASVAASGLAGDLIEGRSAGPALFGGQAAEQVFGQTDTTEAKQLKVAEEQLKEAKRMRVAVEKLTGGIAGY